MTLDRGAESDIEEIYEHEQVVLSDLINRVLDKGVVISSHITISIADVDLIQLDLRLLISAVATLMHRSRTGRTTEESVRNQDADVPVRPDPRP